MKFIRWMIILGVVFGAGYYTGQQPDVVKQTLRDLSGEVLDSTIGLDHTVKVQRQMLEAKEGFIEGRAYLLDHDFEEASGEFERALRHLDQAAALSSDSQLAHQVDRVRRKVREAQATLAQGRSLPSHVLDELRQEIQALLP